MATKIPRVIADLELQLATALSAGGESFTLSSATDDDGEAIPAGVYVFSVDSGTSNKEYLLGQVNGTAVTAVKSVSRQGVQTTGAARAHRVGAPIILTNFAALQLVSDTLRGAVDLDGATPLAYDAEPTLGNREELATVGYVLDNITGGTVAFDAQTISGNAGETISAGDLVYFKTSDQEWYKTDADTADTVEGVQLGIALGSGTDGAGISGGIQIAGTYTTIGLTAGFTYYASNTAGVYSTSAGTTSQVIGIALSTTKLLIIPRNPQTLTTTEKAEIQYLATQPTPSIVTFTSSGAWTKDANLRYIVVEAVGGGGGGGGGTDEGPSGSAGGGGGAGGYARRLILASALGSTETVTIGAAGTVGTNTTGGNGGNTTFGSLLTANGGSGGVRGIDGGAGGAGGTASSGDVNITGGTGQTSGEIDGDGGDGASSLFGTGGFGAFSGSGKAASGYGAGGGGGNGSGSSSNSGGAGAPGIVIVTEYYS